MSSMEERRNSRIPRPAVPPGGNRPLAEKSQNTGSTAAGDRKRRADALEPIPEPSKRQAGGPAARPTRSAPAPPARTTSAMPAQSFQSEGAGKAQQGAAAGEETFEDIQARTGATETDILQKKMSFRKGMKPEKKVEEMVPMVKELRAVGWYLMAGRDKAVMDARQWQTHSEELEAAMAADKEEWGKKQDAIEEHMKEVQSMLEVAEANTLKLTSELAAAEEVVNQRGAALEQVQQQLAVTTTELDTTKACLKDKEAKIKEMEDVVRQSHTYSGTLQTYNTSLQNDLTEEKSKRDEVTKDRDSLQGKVAELGGQVKSLEHQLTYDKDQVSKLQTERDQLSRDVGVLRADLETTRQERDRLLAENTRMTQEVDKIRSMGGKSLETVEALTNDKATMEVQLSTQQRLLGDMRQELALAKEARAQAENTSSTSHTQLSEMSSQVAALKRSLAEAEDKVMQGETIRRKLHNIIQELKGNIRVFCRVRPISPVELSSADHDSHMTFEFPVTNDVLGAGIILQAPARGAQDGPAAPTKHSFTFDKVFSPGSSQELVFEEISELVQSALDGDKVCIFAYGQTGSGKTYTMLGSDEQPGMIPRAMRQIFDTSCKLGSQGWSFVMQASMLEIYNEEYKDLLCKARKDKSDKKHNVVHNADGSTTVTDMTVVDVSSSDKVESLLSQAMERRSVGSTQLNEHSSRSHMVFMLKIEGVNSVTGQTIAGVLNLVDLAGSERIKESGATGQQLKEAQNINKSLSALGDVIASIANKDKHVPFRNSKLTYLLQNCLGGDSKTLMFVNVAPTREFAGESLCSLRFAAKVNACEINPKKQVTK